MQLRPYQIEAIETIIKAIPCDRFILIQAATGAGKSIIVAHLIKRLLLQWPSLRIALLAHRRELINQNKDKLMKVWPEAPIGVACASAEKKIKLDDNIIVGSIQTLVNRVNKTQSFDLIIVDEAHKIPPANEKSQYAKWLEVMMRYNPNVRILGVTATPFRLGHGYIYGKGCKEGNENIFNTLHYRIGIRDLQPEYLCEYRAKECENITDALQKNVSKVGGEYNLESLSVEMSKEYHVGSAIKAINEHATDRKHIVVFAVTINHAEILKKAFNDVGIVSAVVHSEMPLPLRDIALKMFDNGQMRAIINIGVLTEGWDSPKVDCIVMCRPTLSPALFVQMTGRGLRPSPGKKDVLILDLASNCRTHGDPNEPEVEIPRKSKSQTKRDSALKVCPECNEMIGASAIECPECGYVFPITLIDKEQKMVDVQWKQRSAMSSNSMVVSIVSSSMMDFVSKKGNRMAKLSLICKVGEMFLPSIAVNHFFDFEGNASPFGREKARSIWFGLCHTDPPETVDEACDRHGELIMSLPDQIEIIEKDKFWNVKRWMVQNGDNTQSR